MWITHSCSKTGLLQLINLKNISSIKYDNKKVTYVLSKGSNITYMYTTQDELLTHFNSIKDGLKNNTPLIEFHECNDEFPY